MSKDQKKSPDIAALVAACDVQAEKCDNAWRKAGSPGLLDDWRQAWFAAKWPKKPEQKLAEPVVKGD